MKYLVTGKNGQLAKSFQRFFEKNALSFSALDEKELDITDAALVDSAISSLSPDIIINCAAYNFVDKAEEEPDKAFRVNADGPHYLSIAAEKHGSFLVHFGSDYVFDGSKESSLYIEEDVTNPVNVYGSSKLKGENLLLETIENALIFRLSWVFGEGEQNFIAKLLEWVRGREFLRVSCDEFSVPTYTETVVDVCMNALKKGVTGLYHLTNSGYCSRYEWARHVLQEIGIDTFLRPVPMETFHLPARRPLFSAMSNKKISEILDLNIPDWQDAVDEFLLKSNGR